MTTWAPNCEVGPVRTLATSPVAVYRAGWPGPPEDRVPARDPPRRRKSGADRESASATVPR
jgi:hypothetical protein